MNIRNAKNISPVTSENGEIIYELFGNSAGGSHVQSDSSTRAKYALIGSSVAWQVEQPGRLVRSGSVDGSSFTSSATNCRHWNTL